MTSGDGCYLYDVLHVQHDVKRELHVMVRQHGLLWVSVPAQSTESTGVAGPLLIHTERKRTSLSDCAGLHRWKHKVWESNSPQLHDRSEEHGEECRESRNVGHEGGVSEENMWTCERKAAAGARSKSRGLEKQRAQTQNSCFNAIKKSRKGNWGLNTPPVVGCS